MAGRAATLLMIVGGACLACARSSPPPAAPAAPPPAPPSAAQSPPPAPAPAPNPPAPLNATAPQAIAYAIGLLERQQYAQMLEELTWPEDLKRMKAAGKFETVVAMDDFAHKSHFKDGKTCRVEKDGQYALVSLYKEMFSRFS